MTEWNAPEYARLSELQQVMAAEALSLLHLKGTEHVLDLGCGNGKVTAEIAARVPQGRVLGIDASSEMTAFAAKQFDPNLRPNLRFETFDIRHLPFREEFDLVVSFNALHWIPEQDQALTSIRTAMKPGGTAQLRLVSKGKRKSLEDVIEETRLSASWAGYFENFHNPYLHLSAEQYAALAGRCGLQADSIHVTDKAWDFKSRSAFHAFGMVTFVEWTQFLPEEKRSSFVTEVLDLYRPIAEEHPGEENIFKFYQMDIKLTRA